MHRNPKPLIARFALWGAICVALVTTGLLLDRCRAEPPFEQKDQLTVPRVDDSAAELSGLNEALQDRESVRSPLPDPWANERGSLAWTEDEYRRALTALFERDPAAFRKRVHATLLGTSPRSAQRAALRAWHTLVPDARYEPFVAVIVAVDPTTADVRRWALEFVTTRAAPDRTARDTLVEILHARPQDRYTRGEAMFGVLRWGTDAEIHGCVETVYADADPEVVLRAAQALQDSSAQGARATLADLRRRHPVAAVRERVARLLRR